MSPTAPGLELRPAHDFTPQQVAAIDARAGDVFTEAGAGTGKTGVLVERYCDAVTKDGVAVDAILAFTFTERAAGELRERIRRELTDRARAAAEAGDPERAAEIARAARDGERAWVTTIHGFCRRLLATHPVAARMDPRFRVLDEVEAGRLAERAFAAALDEIVGEDEAAARFASGFNLPRLRDLVRTAHERLRSQGVERARLPQPGAPIRSVKEKGEAAELTPSEAARAEEGHAALGALLAAHDRHYEQLKAERSGADFEDLELRALALLHWPSAVREAWRGRFEHLMVDEFQDTNSVQLALVEALRGPETKLFVVGDEFQSIYRFRHADLGVFRRRRAEAIEDPDTAKRPLRGNFRSRPEVLAAINFAGAAMLEGFSPLEAGLEAEAEPPGGGSAVELLLTDASDDAPGKPTGWRSEEIDLDPPASEGIPAYVAEARFLAQRLRELADAGVPRGDMVVLLRAFTHVDAYEEALDRAGLAPYVVGGRGYWSQQQVEDVLRLLGAVANPLDDEVLFGALASPACGVSPDALWLLRQASVGEDGRLLHVWPTVEEAKWPAEMPAEDVERFQRFRATIAALRDQAPLLALESLVDRTISAFDYDLALLSRPGGRRRMANVRKLMRLAREYEDHEGRDLRGFLQFAEERTQRDEREGMAAVQVEGHDGVRVMTVHASKGLQFPVVAVADLGRTLGAGSRDGDIAIGRIENPDDPERARFGMRLPVAAADSLRLWEFVELCQEDRAADVEEACRLVYVAVSRAEQRLILSGIQKAGDLEASEEIRASNSPLKLLLPALRVRGWNGGDGEVELDAAAAVGGGALAGPAARVEVRVQAPSPARAEELRRRAPSAAVTANGAPEHRHEPLLAGFRAPTAVGHLSYSALAGYAGCHYRFYAERVIGLEERFAAGASADERADRPQPSQGDELIAPELGSRERALAIGNSVHAVLEVSARRSWDEPHGPELEAILAREGLASDPEAIERVRDLVQGWLGSELRAELEAHGGRLRAEVPFVLGLAGAVVRGNIDLLAETPEGPLVVDYKTDALRGSDPAELAERYATQRDLYALAVHDGLAGGAAPVVRAAYSFLESPERTFTKTYDESELSAARARLEELVAGIREGDFTRTDTPHTSLCYGCPAAAHLCGAPAWRPQWAPAR